MNLNEQLLKLGAALKTMTNTVAAKLAIQGATTLGAYLLGKELIDQTQYGILITFIAPTLAWIAVELLFARAIQLWNRWRVNTATELIPGTPHAVVTELAKVKLKTGELPAESAFINNTEGNL